LSYQTEAKDSKRLMLRMIFFSGLVIAFGTTLVAQTQPVPTTPRVEFEVASVKPNLGGPESGFSMDITPRGRVTFRNMDLWNLIRTAYGVRDLQMSGGPAWIKNRRFDIQAQAAQSATEIPRDQVLRMLQTLLEDRFHLKSHHESREGPAYGLTVSARGPKLPPPGESHGGTSIVFGDMDVPSMTMDSLCQILQYDLDRPVLNQTGLVGPYAIHLQWASQRARAAPADASRPSPFIAIQEQLGLKLESIKAPVDFFIIDSVEPPTDN
jgi:uncharacterized protein (TIGR03435 family)